jgi:hypothetical protein
MKKHQGLEMKIHTFLISAIDESMYSAWLQGTVSPTKWMEAGLVTVAMTALVENQTPIFQFVASYWPS